MDASSRVIAVLVSTLDGSVIYERFWTRLSELERADLRAAAAATAAGLFAAGGSGIAVDGREAVGRHRSAVLVARCEGSLLLHAAGTGVDHDELALARALRSLGGVLRGTGAGTGSGAGRGGASAAVAVAAAAAAVRGAGPSAAKGLGPAGSIAAGGGSSALSESAALDGYGRLVMAVDDLVFEGILDVTSNFGAARAARLRGCEV